MNSAEPSTPLCSLIGEQVKSHIPARKQWSRGESNPRPRTREPYRASDYGSSSARSGAESDAVGADRSCLGPTDSDLARLIDAWRSLPKSTTTEIVAMLDLAQGKARGSGSARAIGGIGNQSRTERILQVNISGRLQRLERALGVGAECPACKNRVPVITVDRRGPNPHPFPPPPVCPKCGRHPKKIKRLIQCDRRTYPFPGTPSYARFVPQSSKAFQPRDVQDRLR